MMNFQSIRRCSSIGDRITSVLSAIVAAFENSHTVKEDARAMKESKRRKKILSINSIRARIEIEEQHFFQRTRICYCDDVEKKRRYGRGSFADDGANSNATFSAEVRRSNSFSCACEHHALFNGIMNHTNVNKSAR